MAKPRKKGLDYFSFDVDIFEDDKLFDVQIEYGPLGESIYLRLLCLVYKNGYYYKFESLDKLAAMMIKSIGNRWARDKKTVKEVILYLAKCNLFSSELMQRNVITSRSIQERYKLATERRQSNIEEYNLLEKNFFQEGLSGVPKNSVTVAETQVNVTETQVNVNNNTTKESKVNEKYLLTSGNQPENLSTVSTNPTFKEVVACIEEIGGGVNAQKFYNYYSSRGWKDKNGVPIDLKTSVIHWQNTEGKFKSKPKSKSESIPESPMAEAYKKLIYNIDE